MLEDFFCFLFQSTSAKPHLSGNHTFNATKANGSRGYAHAISRQLFHVKVKVKSLYLTNYALRHEGVWGSGCIDAHFLDLGTSWR
jgi:hypothetical protein